MDKIYTYLNYRDFLLDYYKEKKKAHSFYSYRLFSEKAGFKSPNFLKLIIKGDRNLSKDSLLKFSNSLNLKKKETEYFKNLVLFNQSKTLEEKNFYLSALMKYRKFSTPYHIEKSEYAYYSSWYHPVIRELVCAINFKDDFKRLGQNMIPSISARDAQKSVQLLLKLNFIKKNGTGGYVKTAPNVTTGNQVKSVAVANYHKEMMKLASESIERFAASERDISSLTLSVSEEARNTIVEKIQQFRKEILQIAEVDKKTEKVIQINFQMFPVTPHLEREKH